MVRFMPELNLEFRNMKLIRYQATLRSTMRDHMPQYGAGYPGYLHGATTE
jgi:hypothetical protein